MWLHVEPRPQCSILHDGRALRYAVTHLRWNEVFIERLHHTSLQNVYTAIGALDGARPGSP